MIDAVFYRFGLHISRYAKRSILITGALGFAVVYPAINNAVDNGFPSTTGWYLRDYIADAEPIDVAVVQIAPCFAMPGPVLLGQAQQLHEEILGSLENACISLNGSCLSHSVFELPQEHRPALVSMQRINMATSFGIPATIRSLIDQVAIGKSIQAQCLVLTYFIKSRSLQEGGALARQLQGICQTHAECQQDLKIASIRLSKASITRLEQIILLSGYLAVFCYLFICFRRLRLVRSRIGLAVTSFVSIAFAALGAFNLFYLAEESGSLSPLAILPFMVLVLETENIFRATNAVTRVPRTLSPALRMSEAMRNVGPTGLQALLTNLSIIAMFAYVGNSALRQFCGMLAVAIVLAYALHLTFFCAIMSIDVRRTELMDLLNERHQSAPRFMEAYFPVSTRRAGSMILAIFLLICWSSLPKATLSRPGRANLLKLPVSSVLDLLQKSQVDLRVYSYVRSSRTHTMLQTLFIELVQCRPKLSLLLFVFVMAGTYALVTGLITRSGDEFIQEPTPMQSNEAQKQITEAIEILSMHRLSSTKVLLILLDATIVLHDLKTMSRLTLGQAELGFQKWLLSTDESMLLTIGKRTKWRAWALATETAMGFPDMPREEAQILDANLTAERLCVVWSNGKVHTADLATSSTTTMTISQISQALFCGQALLHQIPGKSWFLDQTELKLEAGDRVQGAVPIDARTVAFLLEQSALVYDIETFRTTQIVALPQHAQAICIMKDGHHLFVAFRKQPDASSVTVLRFGGNGQEHESTFSAGEHWTLLLKGSGIVDFASRLEG